MHKATTDSHTPASALTYRPDIDGLRAIAVLSVLVFHYAPEGLAAGFIGVDIFFVISGYLITGILAKSFANRTYSILDFYQRRVRRIFPAMILVLAFCLVVGWFLLFPGEYAQLGKYVAAAAGFVENLVLWQEAGYFDQEAVLKPLLHFWSLAVEEQFYIVWPLLLWLVMWRRLPLLLTVTVIAVLSFLLNIWVLSHDAMAAFYLPLSRAWELMAGAWLAVAHRRQLPWLSKGVDLQAWLGVLLLVIGLVVIRAERGFPGWWGLFPVVGTALLINAGMAAWFNRRVLTWKPAVWVGLISYPLYLWHWTLWSLAIVVFDGTPYRHTAKTLAVVLAIPLAWLTYRYLEQPVRRRGGRTALVLALVVALLGGTGYAIWQRQGVPQRSTIVQGAEGYLQYSVKSPLMDTCFDIKNRPLWYCEIGDVQSDAWVVVYGDSHAGSLLSVLDRYGRERGVRVLFAGMPVCILVLGVEADTYNRTECNTMKARVQELVASQRQHVKAVVLVARWSLYLGGIIAIEKPTGIYYTTAAGRVTGDEAFRRGLEDTADQLQVPVLLLKDNPQQKRRFSLAPLRFGSTEEGLNADAVTRAEFIADQQRVNSVLETVAAEKANIHLLDLTPALCDGQRCPWASGGQFIYRDYNHLSLHGADLVYPLLGQALDSLVTPVVRP